jgi:hypothetical protein
MLSPSQFTPNASPSVVQWLHWLVRYCTVIPTPAVIFPASPQAASFEASFPSSSPSTRPARLVLAELLAKCGPQLRLKFGTQPLA